MKRFDAKSAVAALAVFAGLLAPAGAVPPTAMPSPGYDARLQESRATGTAHAPAVPVPKPLPPRKKKPTNAQ